MKIVWDFLYDLVLALWIGGMTVFTFIVTPVVFKSFARDTAGEIVGRLFPSYFLYMLILSFAALVFFLFISFSVSSPRHTFSFILIVSAILINLFVVYRPHPEARNLKQEIRSFEPVPADSPLRKEFARLHAISATLNLIVLADGVVLLVIGTGLKR